MNEYVWYYHEDRVHLALGKGKPTGREAEKDSVGELGREVSGRSELPDDISSQH